MKFLITSVIVLFSTQSYSHVIETHTHEHEELTQECTQKVRVVTKWKTVYKEAPPKIIYRDRVVYKPKVVYRDRIVYRDKKVPVVKYKTKTILKKQKYLKYPNKNSLSLMGFYQRTKVAVDDSGDNYGVSRDHEADFGLMYQRDFSHDFRFSLGGNLDGGGFLGLGYNF